MNNNITSTAYRLIKPGKFKETTIQHVFENNDVIIRPTKASVCHADLRYYTGNRRKEALDRKLPMALFHEGIGVVEESNHDKIKEGDKVVIVPNIPSRLQKEDVEKTNLLDNYDENAVFMGSGYDGICQSKLVIHGDNVVKIPKELNEDVALLAELCSVSLFPMNQLEKLTTEQSPKIAVFGDGPVGYLAATALYYIFGIKKENIIVFGAVEEKLAEFSNIATTHLVHDYPFKKENGIHTVFECAGGKFSESAINQAIDLIDRQGQIILMGVTEDLVGINTRDILEKGLTLSGSSRSTKKEFEQLMQSFDNQNYQEALSKLIPQSYYEINEISDLNKAMDDAANNKDWKKIYLKYNW